MAKAKSAGPVEHDPKPAPDEISVKIEGGIRSAKLKVGGFRRTHPSGVETIETPEQRAAFRKLLVQGIADAEAALAGYDSEDA